MSPSEADRLLDALEVTVPVHPPVVSLSARAGREAVVFGDTHGDWRSTEEVVRLADDPAGPRVLIGLGDYVDRSPIDSENGSVANALYLLARAARSPDRVFLLEGNHETVAEIPAVPCTLPEEVDALWGPDETRYQRLAALLERGPLALTTESGAYLAHGGFPRGALPPDWRTALAWRTESRLIEVVWSECTESRSRRGGIAPWTERELGTFLAATGLSIVLRGHDPELTGRTLYGGRCLTLQTTRIYERYGGVIAALLPLDRPVRSVTDLAVRHLATEGRHYPAD